MPFSRSGPLRGLDAYCKDDELSEIGSQLAEGSINAGTGEALEKQCFCFAGARKGASPGSLEVLVPLVFIFRWMNCG